MMRALVALILFVAAGSTIYLAWRRDPIRLLKRDFSLSGQFSGGLHRSEIYFGGEKNTLVDVGVNSTGIYVLSPQDADKSWWHYWFGYGGAYILTKDLFVPWEDLKCRKSNLPFDQNRIICSVPKNGATFIIQKDLAEKLFAEAGREFRLS